MPGVQGAGGGGFDPDAFRDFSDILGDFFGFGDLFGGGGGGRRRNRPQRGEDVRYDLEISFEDAVFGMAAKIQVPRMEAVRALQRHGRGARQRPEHLPDLQRARRGALPAELPFDPPHLQHLRRLRARSSAIPAAECRGHGTGRSSASSRSTSRPAWMTARGSGSPTKASPARNGGPPGDLYVFLKVKPHPFFERHENDLHCTIPMNIAQAALGAEIEVPTLEEPHKLKIPEGTQNGAQFRLRHKGVPVLNGSGRGDLYVHVDVKVPTRLTREQRKLLEQLRETLPVDNAPAEKGLFEKVKDYFM